jgi:phenylalanine and histidine ammonia-lyase
MSIYKLNQLLSALDGNSIPEWKLSSDLIYNHRKEVERFIDDGGSAYGFTTFLGHLDRFSVEQNTQDLVLDAHLVGSPDSISIRKMRAITAIKICQLSHGKNGISSKTYLDLILHFSKMESGSIDLRASYGSGDVVPASWWVNSIFNDHYSFADGDIISLINGQFVAAGIALYNYKSFDDFIARSEDCLNKASQSINFGNVQTSVSLRDISPILRFNQFAKERLANELSNSANLPSGNPLFRRSGDSSTLASYSNSSFLNFELSNAIGSAIEAIKVTSSYLRSATAQICSELESREGELIRGAFLYSPQRFQRRTMIKFFI